MFINISATVFLRKKNKSPTPKSERFMVKLTYDPIH